MGCIHVELCLHILLAWQRKNDIWNARVDGHHYYSLPIVMLRIYIHVIKHMFSVHDIQKRNFVWYWYSFWSKLPLLLVAIHLITGTLYEHHGVSNQRECNHLFNSLFMLTKTAKFWSFVRGMPVTGGLPSQIGSDVQTIFMSRSHDVLMRFLKR